MSIYLTILKQVLHTKVGRDALLENYKKKIYKAVVEDNTTSPKAVQLKKYHFLVALLESTKRNLDKGYVSNHFIDRVMDTLVKYGFTDQDLNKEKKDKFKEKYGILPPSFIVLSPTQKCNLKCEGCYASSHENCPTLPFETVDKICEEVYNEWGNRFMTISGGEPLLYKDGDKTLFDIWRKYPEMFFLFYTNSTLITKEIAKKFAELGNVTPAISIEGGEKETDERRGKGIYKKILEAFQNLREAGVSFGVSITATSKNINTLLDENFYKFLFEEQGASYMWEFQLMPIGKAKDMKELMITPEQRVELYKIWEKMLEKGYAIADFWNSGVLSDGCIAYGRSGGYLYVDWNGNIMPCVFVPYYVDNILELHKQGKKLADALNSEFFKNGRKWQEDYGLSHIHSPDNWLMPCSIRDHYKNFKDNILTKDAKPEDAPAAEALKSKDYEKTLDEFDKELEEKTKPIWKEKYLEESNN